MYKSFPKENLIRDWDELLKLSREDVVDLYEEWKEIHKQNELMSKQMHEEKEEKLEEVSKFLSGFGIDVYKYKRSGFQTQRNGYQAWYTKNIVDAIAVKYPRYINRIPTAHMEVKEVNGITLSNNQSPTNLVELYDTVTWQYRAKSREANKADRLLVKSIECAVKHSLGIQDLTPKEIIEVVDEFAKDRYREENVPVGSELHLKNECYGCSTYVVGESRCSCGNRRISIVVEGNLLDGYYHYPEPC
ncbi:hypothetical protein [Bacillus sp. 1006-3]|uniref:hypothetical protein n=1 Tax=Bacillus sp. 1006-3 TaxID=2922309 RepID=UPI001F117C6F|nr:hypothetical protein [Bacillus sp. 1006-3]MCH4866833.1 hypothetical protein [Bacillus sp. 1006-3]